MLTPLSFYIPIIKEYCCQVNKILAIYNSQDYCLEINEVITNYFGIKSQKWRYKIVNSYLFKYKYLACNLKEKQLTREIVS